MDILISNLLSESILDFGEMVKQKIRKYAYLRIFRLATSQRPKLILKADLKGECPYFYSKIFLKCFGQY